MSNDNAAAARAAGSQIRFAIGDVSEWSLDEDLVARALDNLIENALRHARNVTLSGVRSGLDLMLNVADDGRGIPEALRAALFDKFIQVSTPGAPSNRGFNRGLGLTFVRLAAQQHGGDADVTCPASGGSVFTLRFAPG